MTTNGLIRYSWSTGAAIRSWAWHVTIAGTMLVTIAACGSASPRNSTPTQPASSESAPSTSSTSGVQTSAVSSAADGLRLVAIGDSISYNSAKDCAGCTGFVDRYAAAIRAATGQPVNVSNLAQHNGLTLPGLVDELTTFRDRLAGADIIVVAIAHNSSELASDTPCGGSLDSHDVPDWSKLDQQCAVASAAKYRPQFDSLYSQIAAMRAGKPTILRTINRYNDFIGAPTIAVGASEAQKTKVILDEWNPMICASATTHGFSCADIYHAFNGTDGLTPSGQLLASDYTHPSDNGNEVIAKTLTDLGFAPLSSASIVSPASPVGVIAIGHSALTGENSDPTHPRQDAKQNSWATGTATEVNSIYRRLTAIRPATEGHVANTARGGALATVLAAQASAALAMVSTPALVIIETIDNDIRCDGTDSQHVSEFGASVAKALDVITTASPRSRILIVGQVGRPNPSFVTRLVTEHPDAKADLTGNGVCDFFDPSGNLVEAHFATLTSIIDAYEAEQARVCSAAPQCAISDRSSHEERLEDYSNDWNHLNVHGLARAAEIAWPTVATLLERG